MWRAIVRLTRLRGGARRAAAFWLMALVVGLLASACGGADPTPTQPPTPTATPVAQPGATTPSPTATPPPVSPPSDFDAEDYFGGKTIRFAVGASPGGGYDVFTRMVAAAAERYFPESTRFVVRNLPGAGQLRGLRAVLESDPDGLTVGPTHSRWFQRQVLVGDVPGFDLDNIHILGSPSFNVGGDVFCVDRSVASSWEEVLALGRPLLMGATAPGNEPAVEFMAANGGPFKIIYAYGGTSEIMAAFDRGELDFTNRCGPSVVPRLFPEWIDSGRLVPLFYEKKPVSDEYLAMLGHTGPLPSFLDLPGLDVDQNALEALQANLLITEISRVFLLPAGVPEDVRQYWQAAFDQIVVDAQFIEAVKIAGYEDSYGYGRSEDILDIVRRVQGLDQAVKDIILDISGVGELNVN